MVLRSIKFTVLIIILGVFAFSQDIIDKANHNAESIKITAKLNATEDFSLKKKIIWGGVSIITFDNFYTYFLQLIATHGLTAKLPEKRLNQISNKDSYYQHVYRSKYLSTIKWQRLKHSFAVPCVMIAVTPFVIIAMGDVAE